MAFPMRWSTISEVWLNRNCWTYTTSPGTQGHFQPAGNGPYSSPFSRKGRTGTARQANTPSAFHAAWAKPWSAWWTDVFRTTLKRMVFSSQSQSGFGKNRSTEDQVILLTHDIENGFQQKVKTLAVFVDLTKAFDKVWKESLLFKLLRKTVCSSMYSWIQSYFQRSARVRLDGQTSS